MVASPQPDLSLAQLDEDLWRWERRHPEWQPGAFGAVVGSYAVLCGAVTLLIDPLVDEGGRARDAAEDRVLSELDRLVTGRVRILITIPYHARSAELLRRRYADHDATIMGHRLVAKRLADTTGFVALVGGEEVDRVARIHVIGKPVRAEMPIEIPSQRALVFGDAVVEHEGGLRVWESPLDAPNRRRWYDERFLPTLRALTRLDVERILVTHGHPVLTGGRGALERSLEAGPWSPPPARPRA